MKHLQSHSAISFAAPDITDSDIDGVVRVLRSGWLTTGDECANLERELTAYLDCPHVLALSSCTAALEIAIAYLDLQSGAKIGIPTWTFASTGLAAARQGATPVLIDIDQDTLNISPTALTAALEEGLDAVVGVHFGGVPIAPEVHELCREADVPLVEDAAHAFGSSDWRGKIAGKGSVAACFSFYATKNLTCAEGGALATEDPALADFCRSFRLHGLSKDSWNRYQIEGSNEYNVTLAGIKANLPDLLAALARSQLARFSQMQSRRRKIVYLYRDLLESIEGIRFIPASHVSGSSDHLFVVSLPESVDRGALVSDLASAGIGTSVHFLPLHQFTWFQRNAKIGPAGVSTAEALAPNVLSLPLHPGMNDGDVERVTQALKAAIRS